MEQVTNLFRLSLEKHDLEIYERLKVLPAILGLGVPYVQPAGPGRKRLSES